jgi:hypothetical protein
MFKLFAQLRGISGWLLPQWCRPKKILALRARANAWRSVRKAHLQKYPTCEVCGRANKVIVHHIFPVDIAPELELTENNLITLCETPCHFMFGHFFSYHCYNKDVRQMARSFRAKMLVRRCHQYKNRA